MEQRAAGYLWLRCLAAWTLAISQPLFASDPVLLRQAQEALKESIPQVAIQKLRSFLETREITPGERAEATRNLGEALLASGQHDEALATIGWLADAGDPGARLLKADVLAGAERWGEALPIYRALAAAPGAPVSARMGEAEAWHGSGQLAKAIESLELLVRSGDAPLAARLRLAAFYVESEQGQKARGVLSKLKIVRPEDAKWKSYIEGRLLLLEFQPEAARTIFLRIIEDKKHLTEGMLVGAIFGLTDASIITDGYETADRELETFIWNHPESPQLERVFRRLDEVYAQEEDAPLSELRKWAEQPQGRRAPLACYYAARLQLRAKKFEKAEFWLNEFVEKYQTHPWLSQVYLMKAELCASKRDFAGAVRFLEAAERKTTDKDLRSEIELRTGLAHYQAGEYLLAANLFENVARRAPKLKETALYNGALAALSQKHFDRFQELYAELAAHFGRSPFRSQLLLEQGLLHARSGDVRARESLERFLREFPSHVRTGEARLALAELSFQEGESDFAERYRKAANESPHPPEIDDQSQYLAIFLADGQTPRRDDLVIELALKFIRERPQSPLFPEVRMKLGNVFFGKEDFANAETQLVTLARESPESPYAETALFLAGQAAMRSINTGSLDRALDLFEKVIKRDGPLKLYARQQQAAVQDKETEAIKIYDIILAAQPPPDAELRYSALASKGGKLLDLGRKDPKQLEAAIAVFEELARIDSVPLVWRNQALYKKAIALKLQSRLPEALATYYDVLASASAENREFFWFYKAGFDAAGIFESQEEWKSAIGIYDKMAKFDGPRAADAKAKAKQIRLEHFIWD